VIPSSHTERLDVASCLRWWTSARAARSAAKTAGVSFEGRAEGGAEGAVDHDGSSIIQCWKIQQGAGRVLPPSYTRGR
jgi:hypothetical protein